MISFPRSMALRVSVRLAFPIFFGLSCEKRRVVAGSPFSKKFLAGL